MKKLILDTDLLNEMDDQFALAYLISNLKMYNYKYKLEAITVAPFNPSLYLKIKDKKKAMEFSKNEIEKILRLCNAQFPVYLGSDQYIKDARDYNNDGVLKIIDIVEKSKEKVNILCIACPTNIAMALKKAPHIASNIEVVWLGGNGLEFSDNSEFNLIQDIDAVKLMLASGVKITIVPARPVSSALFLSQEVSEKYIKPCGEIGQYLNKLVKDFSKQRYGSGRRLWDVGVIYEYFNRDFAKEKLITEPFRSPIVYKEKVGVKIKDDYNYIFNSGNNSVNFVTYLDTEIVIDDLIQKIYYLNIEGEKENE